MHLASELNSYVKSCLPIKVLDKKPKQYKNSQFQNEFKFCWGMSSDVNFTLLWNKVEIDNFIFLIKQ